MNTTIEQQMKTNKEAYLLVSKSKEGTLKFLEDIGAVKKKVLTDTLSKSDKRSTVKK